MNTPKIRFNGYTEPWEKQKLGKIVKITTGKLDANAMKVDGIYDFYTSGIKKYKIDIPAFVGPAITVAGNGATVGYMHMADGEFNAYQRTYVITDFLCSRQFIYRAIANNLPNKISQEARTGNIPYIVMDMLTDLTLTVPKIEEQTKIGVFFKTLDLTISHHQEKLKLLKEFKKSMLVKLFPRNDDLLPYFRFKGFNDTWEQRKLSDIINVNSGKDYKHLEFGDVPVYGTGGYMLSVNSSLSKTEDAIGIGRKGTINKPYILHAPFWTVDTLFYCLPKANNNLQFLFSIFQKINWKQLDESTGVPSLSKVAINSILVHSTSSEEQIKIGHLFKTIDNTIAHHQEKLNLLKENKKTLLNRLFV